jgi:hypothetical protein
MDRSRNFFRWLLLASMMFAAQWPAVVCAENIDPDNLGLKYAYGENIGWINFKPVHGPGVTVTAAAVTGYAWGENIGWINLSPVNAGVMNDGTGRLSGFGWGENVGWINFAPAGAGVYIDNQGRFFGKAWGENIGWISFNSTGAVPYGVATSFRGRYSQGPQGIPALSGWALVLLALAVGTAGVVAGTRRLAGGA